jgi:hypothetical protein
MLQLPAHASLSIWGSAVGFHGGTPHLSATLYDCTNDGLQCATVGSGAADIPSTGGFAPVTIGLGTTPLNISLGHQLVLRLQCSSGSCWLAYGTTTYPAALTFS